MVGLSNQALKELARYRATIVQQGEIFWVPRQLARYRKSTKPERPWLVVAVDAAQAHLVPGTSRRARAPRLVIKAGETDLPERTQFDFSMSVAVNLIDLAEQARAAAELPAARWPEVVQRVDRSNLVVVKRLVRR